MAVALPWIMAAAAAVSAVGAVQQGQAASDAANYNATIARQNADAANQQAQAADVMLKRRQEQQMGAALASYGAAGVDLAGGSPSDVLAENARMSTLDRLTQQYNYRMRALGYQDQAGLDDANASNSRTASYFNGASAALQGASSAIRFG